MVVRADRRVDRRLSYFFNSLLKRLITGGDERDAVFGMGFQVSLPRLSGLAVGIDFRPTNTVDGDYSWSATISQPVGSGSLLYGIERGGAISISYLTVF